MPRKPMLSIDDLITHSKSKGIKFEIMTDKDAKDYLALNNNYFKLSSYRKNYPLITDGNRKGQYDGLDFAHLVELARIDVEVRHILLKMCLDIEHFLKVNLIKAVETNMLTQNEEDGYKIVTDFLINAGTSDFKVRATNVSKRAGAISRKINQNQKNPYCEGLMKSYQDSMPIWAFVEVISFGDLKDLIQFYSQTTGWTPPVDVQSLDRVRQIRNAAAHNNCIINDLNSSEESNRTPKFITEFVSSAGISKGMRKNKLSNRRINQIVHLFYVYDNVVLSENTRNTRMSEVRHLFEVRMLEKAEYFQRNTLLTSTYEFFNKLISSMT